MKFSEELEKVTLPGSKLTVRAFVEGQLRPAFDMLCLSSEAESLLSATSLTFFTKKALDDQPQSVKVERV